MGSVVIVEMLLAKEAEVNVISDTGFSPLIIACPLISRWSILKQ